MLQRERFTAGVLALVFLTASAGCAKPKEAGVDIKNLSADIVFGVEEEEKKEPVAPAVAPQAPEQVDDSEFPSFEVPESTTPTTRRRPVPLRAVSSCPPAAQNAFPEKETGLTVAELPKEGTYRFKRGGTSTFTVVPGQKFPITGFENRLVRRVTPIPRAASSAADSLEFSFQVVQPIRGGGAIITTYLTRTKAQTVSREGSFGAPPVRTGDPERGITLKAVEVVDAKGVTVSSWTANQGLLLLPLFVVAGEDFQSVAIEGRSGESVAFSGKVVKRQQLDACGQVMDSWRVEGTLQSSVDGIPNGAYVVNFATQFGGIPVFEKYSTADASGTSDLEFTVGTLNPEPLPAEAK